MEIDEIIW